jgi:hypothetical protein
MRQTQAQRILELITKRPGLDDDEIAQVLGINSRQTVNQNCRFLEVKNLICREIGLSGKIVNYPAGQNSHPVAKKSQPVQRALQCTHSARKGRGKSLVPRMLDKTLIIIPCCNAKRSDMHGTKKGPTILRDLPAKLAAELRMARKLVVEQAKFDETSLVPAWQRYDGALYRAAGRRAIGDLMQAGAKVVILSGGYGLVLASEPIGIYEALLKPSWWPRSILQRCLLAYANEHGIHSVRAFASATTSYRRVLQTIFWRDAGIDDALLLTPQAAPGGMVKSPATIGEALDALSKGVLYEGWRSSYGLGLVRQDYR